MYFLSMKIMDHNSNIPLVSEENEQIDSLVALFENLYSVLTKMVAWDMPVYTDNLEVKCLSDAAMQLINKQAVDFEWKFVDKYDRFIKCYITRNV